MSKVIVAGSVNMDVVANATRYPSIGETVLGKQVFFFPGGKGANQAVAASKLGAATVLVGRIGNDSFGADLRAFLEQQQIDLEYLRASAETHTGTAVITVANGNNAIVVIPGANGLVTADDIADVEIAPNDVLVSQFEIPQPTIEAFFRRGRSVGARTILNSAPAEVLGDQLRTLVDVLILNESELSVLAGTDVSADAPIEKIASAARTLRQSDSQVICVTLGARGVLALVRDDLVTLPGHQVQVVDTTGAGDCFVGAVAARLASGDQFAAAFRFANTAASVCVQRMGAGPSMPTISDVLTAGRLGESV